MTPEDRFWPKVEKGPSCWEWRGSRMPNGYGQFYWRGRVITAHRAALLMAGVTIPSGYDACHHCDNRGCVRLEHLFIGTRADNMRDAAAKGRTRNKPHRGELNGSAKLTEDHVLTARRLRRAGTPLNVIAVRMGVHRVSMTKAIQGDTWAALNAIEPPVRLGRRRPGNGHWKVRRSVEFTKVPA